MFACLKCGSATRVKYTMHSARLRKCPSCGYEGTTKEIWDNHVPKFDKEIVAAVEAKEKEERKKVEAFELQVRQAERANEQKEWNKRFLNPDGSVNEPELYKSYVEKRKAKNEEILPYEDWVARRH